MNGWWATAGNKEDLGGFGLWTEERLASHICQISLLFSSIFCYCLYCFLLISS